MSKNVRSTVLMVSIIAIIVGAMVFSIMHFAVDDYKVVLISPTEEQVLNLYKSTSEVERFWVREVHAVKGERSLIEATIGVRSLGGEENLRQILNDLGFDYYVVGKVWD